MADLRSQAQAQLYLHLPVAHHDIFLSSISPTKYHFKVTRHSRILHRSLLNNRQLLLRQENTCPSFCAQLTVMHASRRHKENIQPPTPGNKPVKPQIPGQGGWIVAPKPVGLHQRGQASALNSWWDWSILRSPPPALLLPTTRNRPMAMLHGALSCQDPVPNSLCSPR